MNKGNIVLESLAGLLVISVIIISTFVLSTAQNDLNEVAQNDTQLSNYSKEVMQNNTDQFNPIFDFSVLTVFIFVWLAALLSAWFIDEHPLFIIITIMLLIILIVGSAFLQNALQETIEDGSFTSQYANSPISVWLINNLLIVMVVVALSVGLILYLRFSK